MRQLNPKKYSNSTIPAIFQAILNIALILLAVVLCFLLGKEIVYSIRFVVFIKELKSTIIFLNAS
ncbi:hypothetical protein ABE402_01275 [Bacillus smithii]|uniref:hypothetical protein n=1 Tax=Bacillus smithii TaxID=1479 RepID=UPI003D1E780A